MRWIYRLNILLHRRFVFLRLRIFEKAWKNANIEEKKLLRALGLEPKTHRK